MTLSSWLNIYQSLRYHMPEDVISILTAVLTSYSFVPVFEIGALRGFLDVTGGKVTGGRGVS